MNILLLDPSKKNELENSENLGDLIIRDSVLLEISELFPNSNIVRISTHKKFGTIELQKINSSDLVFVGGTNILTSRVKTFSRLRASNDTFINPKFKNVILMGCGTNVYESRFDIRTYIFYKKILASTFYHSFRDGYSMNFFRVLRKKSLNTCCPTTWRLNTEFNNVFDINSPILFTLTDYSKSDVFDKILLKTIIDNSSQHIFFFPQGKQDLDYFSEIYAEINPLHLNRITALDHDFGQLKSFLKTTKVNYIGTRLHCAIFCFQHEYPNLIVEIDNRTKEISKDIKLNTCSRDDFQTIKNWMLGEYIPRKIKLPLESIKKWKTQFNRLTI